MTFKQIKAKLNNHSIKHNLLEKAKIDFQLILESCTDGGEKDKIALSKAVNGAFKFQDLKIEYASQTFCFNHSFFDNIVIYTNFMMFVDNNKEKERIGHYKYITDENGDYFDHSFFIYGYHV